MPPGRSSAATNPRRLRGAAPPRLVCAVGHATCLAVAQDSRQGGRAPSRTAAKLNAMKRGRAMYLCVPNPCVCRRAARVRGRACHGCCCGHAGRARVGRRDRGELAGMRRWRRERGAAAGAASAVARSREDMAGRAPRAPCGEGAAANGGGLDYEREACHGRKAGAGEHP